MFSEVRKVDVKDCRKILYPLEKPLLKTFGRERLEETAFPVYFNRFFPAAYLGWSRIRKAQTLLSQSRDFNAALDFGSGLGVMLPYLVSHYSKVVAVDLDPDITRFIIDKLSFNSVELVKNISDSATKSFDVIVALDVLEHVDDLNAVFKSFDLVTGDDGIWIISGPTENGLYRMTRKIAGTTGEGHARNIYDVFKAVPGHMICENIYRLPFGIPLFLIARFRKSRI